MIRRETLQMAENCVCGNRESDYGKPEDNFKVIADLWTVYINGIRNIKTSEEYIAFSPEDVAIMMTLMKIGRITTGVSKPDNYVDACGYLACACEITTDFDRIATEMDI